MSMIGILNDGGEIGVLSVEREPSESGVGPSDRVFHSYPKFY